MSTNPSKEAATLAAKLALAGLELRSIHKGGAIAFYEVRRGAEARTCTTLHGAYSILAAAQQIERRA